MKTIRANPSLTLKAKRKKGTIHALSCNLGSSGLLLMGMGLVEDEEKIRE